jgi:hypothetical protein
VFAPGGGTRRRDGGKIAELRAEAGRNVGAAAECLLAVLGPEPEDDDDQAHARAYTGAVLLAQGLRELVNIRKLLTAKEE